MKVTNIQQPLIINTGSTNDSPMSNLRLRRMARIEEKQSSTPTPLVEQANHSPNNTIEVNPVPTIGSACVTKDSSAHDPVSNSASVMHYYLQQIQSNKTPDSDPDLMVVDSERDTDKDSDVMSVVSEDNRDYMHIDSYVTYTNSL